MRDTISNSLGQVAKVPEPSWKTMPVAQPHPQPLVKARPREGRLQQQGTGLLTWATAATWWQAAGSHRSMTGMWPGVLTWMGVPLSEGGTMSGERT